MIQNINRNSIIQNVQNTKHKFMCDVSILLNLELMACIICAWGLVVAQMWSLFWKLLHFYCYYHSAWHSLICLCRGRLDMMRELYQKESEMPTTLQHHEMLAATGNDPFYDRFPWFRLIGRCVPKSCVFTALRWMQTQSSDENSVRLSVHLSVCQTCALWQNGRKVSPDFYTPQKII